MASKASIPKGTRDFSPAEVSKRNYIINTIQDNFKKFGFQPIETPTFENSDTLMGKYGDEGDRLIFKILNSGDFLKNVEISSEDIKLDLKTILEQSFITLFNKKCKSQNSLEFNTNEDFNEEFFKFFESQFFDVEIPKYSFDKELINKIKNTFSRYRLTLIKALIKYISKSVKNEENLFQSANEFSRSIHTLVFKDAVSGINFKTVAKEISEKALKYDLTVPFARYVVQHQNEIDFPFKRYQIQNVYRADRPQKGRFREFMQCDADVIGSDSLWQEVEFIQLYDAVFSDLKLEGVHIKLNNRKILSGLAEVIGESDKLIDFTVALDKLDKVGEEGVKKEMLDKGISENAIENIQPIFNFKGDFSEKITLLESLLSNSEIGQKGIKELKFLQNAIDAMPLQNAKLDLDVTLARGLNYYTGAIFEISAPENVKMGSIGGGGRYDDLTGIFGLKNMSGVGISFGLDRIYLVLEELDLFPQTISENTKVIFINFGEAEAMYAMKAVRALRAKNIAAELYPDAAKMKKQMTYADKRNIPYVVLAGGNEMNAEVYNLKNMKTGEQNEVSLEELIAKFA